VRPRHLPAAGARQQCPDLGRDRLALLDIGHAVGDRPPLGHAVRGAPHALDVAVDRERPGIRAAGAVVQPVDILGHQRESIGDCRI
jgi:hypothetical protein